MALILLVLGISLIIPTLFTKRKWDSEKDTGVFGPTIWEYVRMWIWIWIGSSALLSGIASLFL